MPTSQQECSDILERVRVSSYYIGKLLNDAVQQNRGNTLRVYHDAVQQNRGNTLRVYHDAVQQNRGNTLRVYHDAVQQNRGNCICRLPARNKSTEIFLQNGSV